MGEMLEALALIAARARASDQDPWQALHQGGQVGDSHLGG